MKIDIKTKFYPGQKVIYCGYEEKIKSIVILDYDGTYKYNVIIKGESLEFLKLVDEKDLMSVSDYKAYQKELTALNEKYGKS